MRAKLPQQRHIIDVHRHPQKPLRDLVIRTDEELLEVRNFGETTLKEVKGKLQERGLHLGMKLPSSSRR